MTVSPAKEIAEHHMGIYEMQKYMLFLNCVRLA